MRLYDKVLVSRIHGLGPGDRLNEVLGTKNMCKAMQNVIHSYNCRLSKQRGSLLDLIDNEHKRFEAGEISPEQFIEVCQRLKDPARGKVSATWARRFKKRFMWAERNISAPSHYLPYDDPRQVDWRMRYKKALDEAKIDPRLVLNYDQVCKHV